MKEQKIIDLSVMFFHAAGQTPREIALRDCSLPNAPAMPGIFLALYGQGGQQDLAEAKDYAIGNRMDYEIVDFKVRLDHRQEPKVTQLEDLPDVDFVSLLNRASPSLRNEFGEILRQALAAEGDEAGADYDALGARAKAHFAQDILKQRPEMIAAITNAPQCQHLKIVAYWAKSLLSDALLKVAAIPVRYWSSIQQARCRFNPDITVSLEPPQDTQQ